MTTVKRQATVQDNFSRIRISSFIMPVDAPASTRTQNSTGQRQTFWLNYLGNSNDSNPSPLSSHTPKSNQYGSSSRSQTSASLGGLNRYDSHSKRRESSPHAALLGARVPQEIRHGARTSIASSVASNASSKNSPVFHTTQNFTKRPTAAATVQTSATAETELMVLHNSTSTLDHYAETLVQSRSDDPELYHVTTKSSRSNDYGGSLQQSHSNDGYFDRNSVLASARQALKVATLTTGSPTASATSSSKNKDALFLGVDPETGLFQAEAGRVQFPNCDAQQQQRDRLFPSNNNNNLTRDAPNDEHFEQSIEQTLEDLQNSMTVCSSTSMNDRRNAQAASTIMATADIVSQSSMEIDPQPSDETDFEEELDIALESEDGEDAFDEIVHGNTSWSERDNTPSASKTTSTRIDQWKLSTTAEHKTDTKYAFFKQNSSSSAAKTVAQTNVRGKKLIGAMIKKEGPFESAYDVWRCLGLMEGKPHPGRVYEYCFPYDFVTESMANTIVADIPLVKKPDATSKPTHRLSLPLIPPSAKKGAKEFGNIMETWRKKTENQPNSHFLSPETAPVIEPYKASSGVRNQIIAESELKSPKSQRIEQREPVAKMRPSVALKPRSSITPRTVTNRPSTNPPRADSSPSKRQPMTQATKLKASMEKRHSKCGKKTPQASLSTVSVRHVSERSPPRSSGSYKTAVQSFLQDGGTFESVLDMRGKRTTPTKLEQQENDRSEPSQLGTTTGQRPNLSSMPQQTVYKVAKIQKKLPSMKLSKTWRRSTGSDQSLIKDQRRLEQAIGNEEDRPEIKNAVITIEESRERLLARSSSFTSRSRSPMPSKGVTQQFPMLVNSTSPQRPAITQSSRGAMNPPEYIELQQVNGSDMAKIRSPGSEAALNKHEAKNTFESIQHRQVDSSDMALMRPPFTVVSQNSRERLGKNPLESIAQQLDSTDMGLMRSPFTVVAQNTESRGGTNTPESFKQKQLVDSNDMASLRSSFAGAAQNGRDDKNTLEAIEQQVERSASDMFSLRTPPPGVQFDIDTPVISDKRQAHTLQPPVSSDSPWKALLEMDAKGFDNNTLTQSRSLVDRPWQRDSKALSQSRSFVDRPWQRDIMLPKTNSFDQALRSPGERDPACGCSRSVFSGNDAMRDFFLPLMGMACNCGKQPLEGLVNPEEPTSLENILRDWQVEFLGAFGIYRGDQLVKAHHRSPAALASALRRYRNKQGMAPFRTKNCAMALSIWAKTSKAFVRSIRKQLTTGTTVLKVPNTLYILSSFIDDMPSAKVDSVKDTSPVPLRPIAES
jgi:hypothetical protein